MRHVVASAKIRNIINVGHMQAVILAGGIGAKLRPLTYTTAKLMLKVYDRPFLEHHIIALKSHGISDIIILVGHLGSQIQSFFGDGSGLGVSIKYSSDDMLGSGGAIKNASGLLDDEFLVINGDTYLPEDYSAITKKFHSAGKPCLMTVYKNGEIMKNNACVSGGEVVAYDNTADRGFTHVDAGVTAMKKSVLDMTVRKAFSLESETYPKLVSMKQLACFETKERFFDIRTLQRLENIRRILESD